MNPAQFDPNAELHAAQVAIHNRQHQAAVVHLARLLPQYPLHPHVLGLLEQLLAITPDPFQLVPHAPPDYGTAAIQAYVFGRVGRGAEAYAVLRQLASTNHASGIIDWALPWLDARQLSNEQRAEAVSLYFTSAHYRFGNRKDLPPEAIAVVKRWLPHARQVMTGRPFSDPQFLVYIPMLRQAGEMDEAIRLSQERHRYENSYHSAVSLAATYREARRFNEWLAASHEVLRVAPNDVATRLDLGDCYWEQLKNLEEAEKWYSEALRFEPNQPWAKPSLFAVKFFRTNDAKWRDELEDYAEANPQDPRTQICLGRLTPYFTEFMNPGDASINIMNEVADKVEAAIKSAGSKEPRTGRIKLKTTGLDVPSCRLSIDRQLQLWGGGIALEREVSGMQSPDPRQPRASVRYRLWTYDGTTPRPAVAPPPANVSTAVAQLAVVPYDIGTWSSYAVQIGAQLGEQNISAILGVMAYPPDAPPGIRMWDWTAKIQFAAAFILAGTGPNAFDVLCDLANGPLDWTTAAAVVALVAIARHRLDLAPRVRQLLSELHRDLPRPGAGYYENVILNCHLRLPGLPPDERAAVRAKRAEFEGRSRKPDEFTVNLPGKETTQPQEKPQAQEKPPGAPARTRTSEAELAATMFLSRQAPEGVNTFPLIRQVIETFMTPGGRDNPGFAASLDTLVTLAESFARNAKGEAKAYLDEQARVARLIQAEMKSK